LKKLIFFCGDEEKSGFDENGLVDFLFGCLGFDGFWSGVRLCASCVWEIV